MCGLRYSVRGLLYALCAMPANLSAEYKKAEQAFARRASRASASICLKEVVRAIPEHKGAERMQAKSRAR